MTTRTTYTPTVAGWASHLLRGACGHVLCAFAPTCQQTQPSEEIS